MYQVIKELLSEPELVPFFEDITPDPKDENEITRYSEHTIWFYVFGNTETKPLEIIKQIKILTNQKNNYMNWFRTAIIGL